MYLYKQPRKDGDIYLSIKEKYHVPKVGARERTIEKIGLVSELKKSINDPIAYYTEYAKSLEPTLGIPWQTLQPLIYMFVRACVHYALFEDEDYLKLQLGAIRAALAAIARS